MNLRVGHGSGDGTVNMTGGTLVTNGITMDNNDEGNANINLDGGIIDVTDGYDGVISFNDNSVLAIGDGVFNGMATKELS